VKQIDQPLVKRLANSDREIYRRLAWADRRSCRMATGRRSRRFRARPRLLRAGL